MGLPSGALTAVCASCGAAKEKVVGWYHTGPRLRQSDLDITELMARYCDHPLLVICEVQVPPAPPQRSHACSVVCPVRTPPVVYGAVSERASGLRAPAVLFCPLRRAERCLCCAAAQGARPAHNGILRQGRSARGAKPRHGRIRASRLAPPCSAADERAAGALGIYSLPVTHAACSPVPSCHRDSVLCCWRPPARFKP